MARTGWELIEIAGKTGIDQKWIELAGNGWKWKEQLETAKI